MRTILRAVSLRRFREHKVRTLLTIVGIALGVASFIAVSIITSTLTDSFSRMVDMVSGKVNLQVTGGPTGVEEAMLERVKQVEGVAAAVPAIQTYTKADDGQAMLLLAVDTLNDKAVRDYKMQDAGGTEIADPLLFLNTQNAILLNKDFARKNKIAVDATINLLTPQGRRPFVVRGLLDPKGAAEAFGGRFALMDVYSAQLYFGKQKLFDSIDVLVKTGENVDEVRKRIASALGGGYTVQRPAQRTQNVGNLMASFKVGLAI
jgi:putative ABC transport system permease protein